MNSKHAKSPCCGASIRRFGQRRRQCTACQRTWTIRPRKRGRPGRRLDLTLLRRVFVEGFTLCQLAGRHGRGEAPAYRKRFRHALQRFVRLPAPQVIPAGPLVLLIDGVWFQFGGRPWVLYLMALKACRDRHAVFLDPLLLPGTEHVSHWARALAALPPAALSRIHALVADNLPGLRPLAATHGWTLQLCHFHLLLKLEAVRRGRRARTLRGGSVREELIQLVRDVLDLPPGPRWHRTVAALQHRARGDCGTQRIQMMVRECLRNLACYRAYRDYPTLALPRTTNSVEAMGCLLRDLFRRTRAGSTPRSVLLWATAFIRLHPTITCNSYPINRIW